MPGGPQTSPLRRAAAFLVGTTFIVVFFGVLPAAVIELNDLLGWPRWQSTAGSVLGAVIVLAAVLVALYCSGLFAWRGRGTPVPVDPPKRLVISGLYRYSRNPIYVAYVAAVVGMFFFFGHLCLLLYAGVGTLAIHLVVLVWEEPQLRGRFGKEYLGYCGQVPRWLGRRSPEARSRPSA
jgi:protein-S-isoprenylcysteine O-methyltransferase Ste14